MSLRASLLWTKLLRKCCELRRHQRHTIKSHLTASSRSAGGSGASRYSWFLNKRGHRHAAVDFEGNYRGMARPRGMRKVPARLLVLALSIVAGGIAAYLAAGGSKNVVT